MTFRSINELNHISKVLTEMSYENWNEVIVRLNRTTKLNSFLTLIGNSNLVPFYRTHHINKRGKILIIGDAKQSVNDIEKVCKEEYGITKIAWN